MASITLGKENAGQAAKRAKAEVTVSDNCEASIAGATVYGDFSGDYYNESGSAVTDENGIAVISTVNTTKGKTSFQFCVIAINSAVLPNPDCKSL